MQWFCLLFQLIDIGHYRYHLPEKNRSLQKCNGFVYLCCSVSWHWTLSISLTRQIGAYENAMGLSTCVVQLVDPFIMYVCFILTRFVPN